jgi:hypothetical protein
MVFIRSSAPTFWTQVTTHNNKALRVVSGTGAGSGGVNTFTGTFDSKSASANIPVTISGLFVGGVGLSVNQLPVHAHGLNSGGNTTAGPVSPSTGSVTGTAPGNSTGNAGSGGAHAHPLTYTSANGTGTANANFSVQYVNCIICSFN